MRNRVIEVFAAVVGIALVVVYYLDQEPATQRPSTVEAPVAPASRPAVRVEDPAADTLTASPAPAFPPASAAPVVDAPRAAPASEPAIDDAQAAWETARAEVAEVRNRLERLDDQFDEKDAEFARLESEGMDPEELEERMLIFLDSIVEKYEELEARLAAAQAAEQAAAARLEALAGNS